MHTKSREHIARSAGRISGATVVSRLLGLARDSIFAAIFGTTYFADAFNVAFLIPNFLRRVFGEGTLNASYVPVYTQSLHREGDRRAQELAAKTFSVMGVVLGIVVVLGILFARPIVATYAFGWKSSPEVFAVTVRLTRVLFPYIFFVALAAVSAGTLNSRGYFGLPALAPALLNVALIGTGLVILARGLGAEMSSVTVFSVGALIGGVLQIAVQTPLLLRTGHRIRFDPDFRDPRIRWIGRLMLPGVLAFAVTQINVLVDTLLATTLPEGSVTALRLGNRLAIQPLGVFGVAITTAALPTLSAHAARDDLKRLVGDFSFSLRLMLALLIPSTVGLLVVGRPIVRLLFERGEFTAAESTPITSSALFYYALGLVAYGGMKATVQAFYSLKDTVTPMKVAMANVILNIGLNLVLVRSLGLIGLALATSVSSTIAFTLLLVLLWRRLGSVQGEELRRAMLRVCGASAAMGGVVYWLARLLEPYAVNLGGKALQVGASMGMGLGVFTAVSFALRSEEVIFLYRTLVMKRGKDEGGPSEED
jgi:putative peptidoglycan lipid II flippase